MEIVEQIGQQLQMNDMRKKGLFTDGSIHIPAENVSLPIHKATLASCSSYFRSLFTWGMCNHEYENDVTIPGVSAKTMEAVIEYAYVKRVDIHSGNVEDLIAAADRFHIFGLQKHCTEFLLNEITTDNCIGIRLFFEFYSCMQGLQQSNEFISRNFTEVSETSQEFLQMSFDNLKNIITKDEIYVSDESEVLSAILRWVRYDQENRQCCLAGLLSEVRLTFVNDADFDNIMTSDLLQNCRRSKSMLEKAKGLKDRMLDTQSVFCNPCDNMLRPRVPGDVLFVVGGWSSNGVVGSMETYDRYTDQWYEVTTHIPHTRAYHATVHLRDAIYIMGGYDGVKYLASVTCFRPETHTWESRARMHTQRCYVAGVDLQGKEYMRTTVLPST